VCKIGTMEYAIADVANYLTEKKQQGKAAVWEQYPNLEPSGKLFLRRKQGEENWQAKLLDFDSTVPAWEESTPGITFADEQNGMISFGWWYTVLLVTGDGGETWEMTRTVPEPGMADHNRADCIINCGENRYLVGYRYLTRPKGSIWLTKDNGDTWEQVEIAVPKTQETFCYVEPVEASYDGERAILKMRMVLEDEHGVRSESFYDTVSKDGGETWE
ncbi:MAG: hypothetical protein K2O03_08625, partial [Lachnospiraceae bacterium]|nr:hypothetical protein [Lachnospiraceae bacterium]